VAIEKCGFAGVVASRPEVTIHHSVAMSLFGFVKAVAMRSGFTTKTPRGENGEDWLSALRHGNHWML
jgi:hypothetical protein